MKVLTLLLASVICLLLPVNIAAGAEKNIQNKSINDVSEPKEDKKKIVEKNEPLVEKPVNILFFTITMNTPDKKYDYYSTVIPRTIKKTLENNNLIRVTLSGEPPVFTPSKNAKPDVLAKEIIEYEKSVASIAKNTGSAFSVTGQYSIEKNRIKVTLNLISTRDWKKVSYSNDSGETGVQLEKLTDKLSSELSAGIISLETAYREAEKKPAPSPYLGLYEGLHTITLGVETGKVFFMGEWKGIYNRPDLIRPYISFSLPLGMGLTFSAPFYSVNNDDLNNGLFSIFQVNGGSANLSYSLYPVDFFGVSVSAGGGMVKTEITVPGSNSNGPFSKPLLNTKSTDPLLDVSAFILIHLSSIELKGGATFQRILYKDNPMNSYIIFGGAGFRI